MQHEFCTTLLKNSMSKKENNCLSSADIFVFVYTDHKILLLLLLSI